MIEARRGPGGTRVYRARVYYRGRYVASRTFARKRDAQEWERRQVESLRMGLWADPAAGDRPVREWCEVWLSAQPARQPATERKIRGVISKQIARAFGRRPLVSVRPSEVQTWAAELSQTSRLRPPATHSAFCGGRSTTPFATERSTGIRPLASDCRRFRVMTRAHLPMTSSGSSRSSRCGPRPPLGPRRRLLRAAVGRAGRAPLVRRRPGEGHASCRARVFGGSSSG